MTDRLRDVEPSSRLETEAKALLSAAAPSQLGELSKQRIKRAVLAAPVNTVPLTARWSVRLAALAGLAAVGTAAAWSIGRQTRSERDARPTQTQPRSPHPTAVKKPRPLPALAGQPPSSGGAAGQADLLFHAGHEQGTEAEWVTAGLGQGGLLEMPGARVQIATGLAQAGRYAARIVTENGAADDFLQGGLYTEGLAPDEAIYGAWYYLPAPATPRAYWVLLKLRSRLEPARAASWLDVWDVTAHVRKDRTLGLVLYHAGGLSPRPDLDGAAVPIGRWFHLEVEVRSRPDDTGRIALRIDGRTVYQREGIPTMPSRWARFFVGSLSRGFAEGRAEVIIDEATISRR